MTIQQFLEVIYANRDLLGDPKEKLVPEDTHCMSANKGCPLRVALIVCCPVSSQWRALFIQENGFPVAINPNPMEAAYFLDMNDVFAIALAYGWDDGKFFCDEHDEEDFHLEFAGFLIGVSLRPAPLQLTSG